MILATTTTIGRLGFKGFEIRINERRILKAMAAYSGFSEREFDTVFIILDKMDKIGLDGVAEELLKEGYAKESVEKYLELFRGVETAENRIGVSGERPCGLFGAGGGTESAGNHKKCRGGKDGGL